MNSIVNIDQHKVFFPMEHNTIGFASKTHSPFIQWSPGALLEGQ